MGVYLKNNNNPVYETAKETLMYRTVFLTLWERERVGKFGVPQKRLYDWNTLLYFLLIPQGKKPVASEKLENYPVFVLILISTCYCFTAGLHIFF